MNCDKYCKHCGKKLKSAQYSADKTLKSCPRCSVLNGQEHVYFPYPASFGETGARATANNPDGPQSYCTAHRSNPKRSIPEGGILCSQVKWCCIRSRQQQPNGIGNYTPSKTYWLCVVLRNSVSDKGSKKRSEALGRLVSGAFPYCPTGHFARKTCWRVWKELEGKGVICYNNPIAISAFSEIL